MIDSSGSIDFSSSLYHVDANPEAEQKFCFEYPCSTPQGCHCPADPTRILAFIHEDCWKGTTLIRYAMLSD